MDIGGLLKLLNEHDARYIIIGAAAFPAHGWSRTTRDIDILIEATIENAQRVKDALTKFGYDMTDASIEDLLTKKVLLRQYILETDIHPFVTGAEFQSVWENRVDDKLYGVPTHFASLKDLINMKRAAGRPKDMEDLKYLLDLEKLKKEEEDRP